VERGVKDAATLENLVAKHASSLEPGLTIVDTSAMLGESTIDLVGVAPDGSLVLIALGLVGDGGMILRALGAYAWCVEYPDAVRQRYRAIRRELQWPPRIVFVAEGLPESFVRKVKRLGVPSIDCVEFRALESHGTSALRFERRQRVRLGTADASAVAAVPLAADGAAPSVADAMADGDPVAEAVIAITTAAEDGIAAPGAAAHLPGVAVSATPTVATAAPAPVAPAPPPAPPSVLVPEPVRLQTPQAVTSGATPVSAPAAKPVTESDAAPPEKSARGRTRRRRTPAWPPTPSMLSAEEKNEDDEDGES
jgi:hypothetical protein